MGPTTTQLLANRYHVILPSGNCRPPSDNKPNQQTNNEPPASQYPASNEPAVSAHTSCQPAVNNNQQTARAAKSKTPKHQAAEQPAATNLCHSALRYLRRSQLTSISASSQQRPGMAWPPRDIQNARQQLPARPTKAVRPANQPAAVLTEIVSLRHPPPICASGVCGSAAVLATNRQSSVQGRPPGRANRGHG